MTTASRRQKAEMLLSLHNSEKMLVLPNVWNPLGARIVEKKGGLAVATASAAISASLGCHDGEILKRATMIDIIANIARSVQVPVTADIESGYGESLAELEQTAEQVIEAGVVGINIEDSLADGTLRPVEEQCQRIATIRQVAGQQGMHLVINARTDSFMLPCFTSSQDAMEEAVIRAKAYSTAGADCIYPIGPGDEASVRQLRKRIAVPLNILASPKAAPLEVIQEIGVNRVSFGPFLLWSCLQTFSEIADGLLCNGDYSGFKGMLSKAGVAEYLVSSHE